MSNQKNIVWIYVLGAIILIGIIVAIVFANQTPTPTTDLTDADWIRGNKNASVTLIEYSDFQCPACGSYYPVVKELEQTFEGRLRVVYRHFPLTQLHSNAMAAAQAAEAAGRQGKFWEMHDMLFEKQREWENEPQVMDIFVGYALNLYLNDEQFVKDYGSVEVKEKIAADIQSAAAWRINSTPTFVLNGEVIKNPDSPATFRSLIEAALANAPLPTITSSDLASAADVHEHVDFALYINSKAFDFSPDKYQSDDTDHDDATSTEADEHDPYTHLHDKKGTIIHKHKDGVTLGYFFKSIGMEFNKDCLTLDTGERYCSDADNSLKFFVNGSRSSLYDQYELHDLDRVLVSFGPLTDSAVDKQLTSVTNDACIYSEKCPERGTPPEEKCVGGLGTNCEQ